jgi:exodeoxyribonuclease VII large subunit
MRAPTPTAAAEMAVPVRAELQAQLATWGGRMIGAANRQQALRGERLTALARHLPRRDALYAPQRQRLDDAGERLDRGQRQRLGMLGERLGARGAALRPALLARAWDRDRAKLDGLGRLLASLDPRALLSRGYAMVRDAGGVIVTSAAKARDAGHLRLQFADGELPVTVGEGGDLAPSSMPRPARKASPPAPKAGQGELF